MCLLAGLLVFREAVQGTEEEVLLSIESHERQQWNFRHPLGYILVFIGLLQSVTGIASQILSPQS